MPTWAVVLLSVGAGVTGVLLVFVTLAVAIGSAVPVPSDHEIAAGCQRSLDAVADQQAAPIYLTYDPRSVTVTETAAGSSWDVYGEVRFSSYAYTQTHTYECRGMTRNDNGTWNIADRSLS